MNTPPPTFPATRDALHRLAVYVISPWRKQRTGRIGLRATPGGFGTPPTGDAAERVMVVPGGLVFERAGEVQWTAPFTSLSGAAGRLGLELDPEAQVGSDVPPMGDPDAQLEVDQEAARFLGDWYALGDRALQQLRATAGDGEEPSDVQIWPEHFDIATEIGAGPARAGYGASPGDAAHPLPYLYGLPWTRPPEGDAFWDEPHFPGRSLSVEHIHTEADASAFLAECRARVMADHPVGEAA